MLDVLTQRNRPPLAATDKDWKDDVAPEKGSPFRPLYDDKILFSRQPIALVLAEDWDTARFAASLLAIEYEEEPSVTDLEAQRRELPLSSRSRRSRAAMRRRALAPPPYGMRPSTSFPPSTTTRWSSMRRRRCGTAAS